jgi:hypothetical protein
MVPQTSSSSEHPPGVFSWIRVCRHVSSHCRPSIRFTRAKTNVHKNWIELETLVLIFKVM